MQFIFLIFPEYATHFPQKTPTKNKMKALHLGPLFLSYLGAYDLRNPQKRPQTSNAQIHETRAGFEASWDSDGMAEEDKKIATLSVYLPDMLSEQELRDLLQEAIISLWIDEPKKNRGPLIWALMAEYGARVDGKLLNEIINSL